MVVWIVFYIVLNFYFFNVLLRNKIYILYVYFVVVYVFNLLVYKGFLFRGVNIFWNFILMGFNFIFIGYYIKDIIVIVYNLYLG